MTNEIKTAVYEVKINRKWSKVRATSMKALNDWADQNGATEWVMVGMMSIIETAASQNLKVVA
jgi:hypothetical protein